jgi:hypothetical protein
MILILTPDIDPAGAEFRQLTGHLAGLPGISYRIHSERGEEQLLTEIYLIGHTAPLSLDEMAALPGVERVVRVSEEYRVLGRHKDDHAPPTSTTTGCASARTTSTSSPACARWTCRNTWKR